VPYDIGASQSDHREERREKRHLVAPHPLNAAPLMDVLPQDECADPERDENARLSEARRKPHHRAGRNQPGDAAPRNQRGRARIGHQDAELVMARVKIAMETEAQEQQGRERRIPFADKRSRHLHRYPHLGGSRENQKDLGQRDLGAEKPDQRKLEEFRPGQSVLEYVLVQRLARDHPTHIFEVDEFDSWREARTGGQDKEREIKKNDRKRYDQKRGKTSFTQGLFFLRSRQALNLHNPSSEVNMCLRRHVGLAPRRAAASRLARNPTNRDANRSGRNG